MRSHGATSVSWPKPGLVPGLLYYDVGISGGATRKWQDGNQERQSSEQPPNVKFDIEEKKLRAIIEKQNSQHSWIVGTKGLQLFWFRFPTPSVSPGMQLSKTRGFTCQGGPVGNLPCQQPGSPVLMCQSSSILASVPVPLKFPAFPLTTYKPSGGWLYALFMHVLFAAILTPPVHRELPALMASRDA